MVGCCKLKVDQTLDLCQGNIPDTDIATTRASTITTVGSTTPKVTTTIPSTTTVLSSPVHTSAGVTRTTRIHLTKTPPSTRRNTTPKATAPTTSSSTSKRQNTSAKSTSIQQPPATKQTVHLTGNIRLCSYHHRITAASQGNVLTGYGHSCYELVNHKASWNTADNYCQRRFGHLVQINDTQEEAFIQQFMNSHSPNHAVWIGLQDRYNEEIFTWTTGDRLQYTNWVPGRKNNFQNHDSEDCVIFLPYKQGQWDDVPCGYSGFMFHHHDQGEVHPYICEYKISGSVLHGGNLGTTGSYSGQSPLQGQSPFHSHMSSGPGTGPDIFTG